MGQNKDHLNAAKRENYTRGSGVRKEPSVDKVKNRSKSYSTWVEILHCVVPAAGKTLTLLKIDNPFYLVL